MADMGEVLCGKRYLISQRCADLFPAIRMSDLFDELSLEKHTREVGYSPCKVLQ
jgi:hypothetical protein